MAFREVGVLEVKEVLRLWLSGREKKVIARRVGVDVKTVRRYVAVAEECGLRRDEGPEALSEELFGEVMAALASRPARPRGASWQSCVQHREKIAKLLRGKLRLTKVRKLLRRQGIDIPYPTLYRFAQQELGFGRRAPTIAVADGDPGVELQVDTGWMTSLEPDASGRRRRFRAFVFTPGVSRYRFSYPAFRETTADAIEACEAAWEFYGGVFRVLIPDRTKAIVDTSDPLTPRIVDAFREYAQARGFEIDPTRARKPQDKARVERSIRHVRDDCFAGEHLITIEHARAHAQRWCLEEDGLRRHSRTQRLPREHFEAVEKGALLPAPSEPYDLPAWSTPKVARDQFAQVAKALYSLPRRFVGRRLRARADSQTVRFYERGVLVKTHPRKPPGGRSTEAVDFPPEQRAYAQRDSAFLVRQATSHGTAVGRFAEALLDVPLPWTRMRRVYALLGLAKKYGAERVERACALALDVEMIDVTRLRRLLELGREDLTLPPARDRSPAPSRFLRPTKQYALPLAPKGDDH